MTVTAESPNRRAYLLLGCALAISVVLAFPMEQIGHEGYPPDSHGPSCSNEEIGLDLGNIVQAILPPLFVFLLPGPGSIFQKKSPVSSRRSGALAETSAAEIPLMSRRASWDSASFIIAGWLCAAVTPVGWWYGLRRYARLHGECAALYDWSLPVHRFQPDYVSDFFHYFIYVSMFSAFWVGITAGGLRLQSARAAARDTASNKPYQFQSFRWACFLGWAVQYRISQWWALQGAGQNQEWAKFAALTFCFVTVGSFWVLAFTHSLWNKKPRTWLQAFLGPFWRSFLVYLLTVLTFFWLFTYAVLPLVPAITTWYAFGLAWALFVGTWQWRALQKEQLEAVVPRV